MSSYPLADLVSLVVLMQNRHSEDELRKNLHPNRKQSVHLSNSNSSPIYGMVTLLIELRK
ncbi:hypothetical protein BCT82_16420 [Vibrio breoganii]|nr:hypothetical protein A6D95_00760 [Vibrio breoganii]PMK32971.1 hypothetical protein BCU06_01870 [Vibrio breoganii]PML22911.1 hypothetical protein BCT82_16420 [Vibrio breoganii]